MSDEERKSFDTLIFLCVVHHKTIDERGAEEKYSVESLRNGLGDFGDDVARLDETISSSGKLEEFVAQIPRAARQLRSAAEHASEAARSR
ncbi:hypothetical protein [Saccharopolyspora hordei]|uniref:Uncharacterized protein n=1 Tax=Saccharopolyspora hordei TaxID=1838 RepID=A0A853AND2_9PSEU|nr:hypothetical protein [Saccharopolyspora hordei]NYI85658.1 hypothetical protein [Saccharopolyspora hordei]